MTTEARLNNALQHFPRMKEVIAIEPNVLTILTLAASQDCRSERWQIYEMLKYVSCHYVGWDAKQEALRNSGTYSMMMDALDWLLPSPEMEDETLLDADREVVLQQLRDAVKQTFQISLPGARSGEEGFTVVDGWLSL